MKYYTVVSFRLCSPPISGKEKDGTLCLCIEYRDLNSKTKDTAIPSGNVLEVVESMAGARYFIAIDLAGYYQVSIV